MNPSGITLTRPSDANLSNANLRGGERLTRKQLAAARNIEKTMLPNDLPDD